mmetsp:Transcript_32371/g.80551  ORF Transcript_32371/g.80551 Transcript_32371/m.80551 type:complete len:303 (-) Transcript_32371:1135-2043(-)
MRADHPVRGRCAPSRLAAGRGSCAPAKNSKTGATPQSQKAETGASRGWRKKEDIPARYMHPYIKVLAGNGVEKKPALHCSTSSAARAAARRLAAARVRRPPPRALGGCHGEAEFPYVRQQVWRHGARDVVLREDGRLGRARLLGVEHHRLAEGREVEVEEFVGVLVRKSNQVAQVGHLLPVERRHGRVDDRLVAHVDRVGEHLREDHHLVRIARLEPVHHTLHQADGGLRLPVLPVFGAQKGLRQRHEHQPAHDGEGGRRPRRRRGRTAPPRREQAVQGGGGDEQGAELQLERHVRDALAVA